MEEVDLTADFYSPRSSLARGLWNLDRVKDGILKSISLCRLGQSRSECSPRRGHCASIAVTSRRREWPASLNLWPGWSVQLAGPGPQHPLRPHPYINNWIIGTWTALNVEASSFFTSPIHSLHSGCWLFVNRRDLENRNLPPRCRLRGSDELRISRLWFLNISSVIGWNWPLVPEESRTVVIDIRVHNSLQGLFYHLSSLL
ncbi:hypothetical protein J6590_027032 [Homalodisca vitripennis]|nr:hypothetical protein J6590_027032 [Homalodisca vitripennis]